MTGKSALAGAARGAVYTVGLQLTLRAASFLLNAFILRVISKDLLGIANVRLVLLYNTVFFMTSEGFRKACLSRVEARDWQQTVNLLWLMFPLGVVIGGALIGVWLWWLEQPDPIQIPYYTLGVLSYGGAAILEMLCQPLVTIGEMLFFTRLKAVIFGCTELMKIVIIVSLLVMYPHIGLLAYAIAETVGCIFYVSSFWIYFGYYFKKHPAPTEEMPFTSLVQFLPRSIPNKSFIDFKVAGLVWSFVKQSYVKHFLTEGEKIVMTVFDVLSFGDQGVYEAINNLGSLAPRILFLPIEDNSYLFYTHSLVRGQPISNLTSSVVSEVAQVLSSLLKFVSLIGLTAVVFGYSFSFLALDIYSGATLSEGIGPTLLRWYCFYVLVIAVNGSTECFMFAAMSEEEVGRYNTKLVGFSGVFLFFSWLLTKWLGSVGFILANCLNMGLRIGHSLYFIHNYFHNSGHHPLRDTVPAKGVLGALAFSFIATLISECVFCCDKGPLGRLLHIGVGGACGILVLASVYLFEKKLIDFMLDLYRSKKRPKTE